MNQADQAEASNYLEGLLGRMFRIHVKDSRMFLGEFKCTDNESNVILGNTYEYRMPSQAPVPESNDGAANPPDRADMTSRFLGLVVIPGHHIANIEVEERPIYGLPIR